MYETLAKEREEEINSLKEELRELRMKGEDCFQDSMEELNLDNSKDNIMSTSSIPKELSPGRDSLVERFAKGDDSFSLSNVEHKMIL